MTDLRKMSLFRDVQVALDFQQMAEQGYIDTEFTMYGYAYWQNDERHYLVSEKEKDMIAFRQRAVNQNLCPTPVTAHKQVCPVPAGMKEDIAHTVKIALAQQLAADYPAPFLQGLAQMAARENNDTAAPLLWELCRAAANCYSEERLSLLEGLITLAFNRKTITKASHEVLSRWLAEERENMLEDIHPQDILCKSFHTIMYETAPEQYRYATNARLEWVYGKKEKLEREGKLVSPIYTQRYWYNNQTPLDTVKESHQKRVQAALDAHYFAQIRAISTLPAVFTPTESAAAHQWAAQFGEKAVQMLADYGRLWRLDQ